LPSPIAETTPLILASGSKYRAELLARLRLPFVAESSEVDESPQPGEAPATLALRLARAKALAVAARRPGRCVLGSDQVATFDGRLLGKPGSRAAAVAQLEAQSGRTVEFFTAVALVMPAAAVVDHLDRTVVRFRPLSAQEIRRYVDAEPALDCAGAFKCEGLGISLLAAIESQDPTGLIGLPLIAVRELLARAGCPLP